MIAKTKDIKIGEQEFQISRMTARNGSWVAMQLLTKLLPSAVAGAVEQELPMPHSSGKTEMSEDEFVNLQSHCLRVCSRYETVAGNRTAVPILMADGRWAATELEYDIVRVLTLTVHALVFNMSPFFEEGALKPLLESLPGLALIPSNASK